MPPPNGITIAPCLEADIPAGMAALSAGFADNAPFVSYYFPGHLTPAGQKAGAERLLEWKQGAPNSTFLKAVAEGDGGDKVVGLAVWTFMDKQVPSVLDEVEGDVEGTWVDEEDREHMRALWRKYVVYRNEAIEGSGRRGVMVLEALAVDANYQRRGAGLALTDWGIREADKRGIEAVVEATSAGRRTYEKAGLRAEVERMDLDVGERFKERRKPQLIFMRRKPGGNDS